MAKVWWKMREIKVPLLTPEKPGARVSQGQTHQLLNKPEIGCAFGMDGRAGMIEG